MSVLYLFALSLFLLSLNVVIYSINNLFQFYIDIYWQYIVLDCVHLLYNAKFYASCSNRITFWFLRSYFYLFSYLYVLLLLLINFVHRQ